VGSSSSSSRVCNAVVPKGGSAESSVISGSVLSERGGETLRHGKKNSACCDSDDNDFIPPVGQKKQKFSFSFSFE
jgi:hypothetical protein